VKPQNQVEQFVRKAAVQTDAARHERVLQEMQDAYGKAALASMAQQLQAMPDPQVAGGAIIFIYAKQPLSDPSFEQNAEALALFIPRDNVIAFAQLRMTLQTLFSASDMLPVLQGAEQVQNLRLYIIQP
jgi:hypothetical protein